jgi:cellulose synthase operon protein YhjU
MGIWSYYFFAKLLMFCAGFIGFHVWENLLFALFVALPARHWVSRALQQIVAVPAGLALLYHDSWLPPWRRIAEQWGQLSDFSAAYFAELAWRSLNPQLLLALLLLLVVWWVASRKLRVSSFAIVGIVLAPWLGALAGIQPPPEALPATAPVASNTVASTRTVKSAQDLDTVLGKFYLDEATRRQRFTTAAAGPPFDVLLLQVCSLAWDDLDFAGLRDHPLLSRFDLRFERFNAAASYSGPAAIRLLRASCGQQPHEGLYQTADPDCQLMSGLRSAGFEPQWAMNHDGKYGGMLADISVRGGLSAPLFLPADQKPALIGFDDTPYFSDYEVLSAWWRKRLQTPAARVALYYNTGTLHDGNRFPDGARLNVRDSYRRRAQSLFADLQRFLEELEGSGRQAVVILVPEHGANARGDHLQISGLREIPTPGIALVPAGIRLVGAAGPGTMLSVDSPSSHFALAALLAKLIEDNPFSRGATPLADHARNLPQTSFVAENEGMIMLHADGAYWHRTPDGSWTEFRAGR